jgi:Na+(H+)/acetate symporter ActP
MTYGLPAADAAVLLAYLFGTTALGIWVGRRSRTVAEYFMPRKFSKPVMIMYAIGTGTASDQAVLAAAATFKHGLSGIWYQWLWLFATPFYWMIAPVMRRFRAITTADVYELRFNRGVANLFAALGIVSMTVKIGVLRKGSAFLLEGCTDGRLDARAAILAMSALFVVYGTTGGLTSVVLTDFVQGLFTLLAYVMRKTLEGWSAKAGLHRREAQAGQRCHSPVRHDSDPLARVVPHERSREWNEDEPEQKEAIEPEETSVRFRQQIESTVVCNPPDRDDEEAQRIAQELRHNRDQASRQLGGETKPLNTWDVNL